MALELVGGAFLSSFLNVLLDRMASREFINFFNIQEIELEMINDLKSLLYTVSVVLDDAEDRQFTCENIKNWTDELRDATYDADDLLNELDYQVTRYKVESEHPENHVPAALNFTEDQQDRMKKIVKRLKYLVDGSVALRLKERAERFTSLQPTTPVVRESGIVGRDEDKKAILKLLEANEGADQSGIGVIPIVGMGGIGKTTLARLVYNDNKAKELFQIRAWVCVSENYDGLNIKRDILKHITKSGAYDHLTPEDIDEGLMENLKDKSYLLVLDDLWNDDCDDWERLFTPLMEGAHGSKIIVTTRNQSVASRVCIVPSYELNELDSEYSWQLFVKHAFPSGKADESLADIGKKIVRKCKGLPLAVKMVGDLLRDKRKVREWKSILESSTWDFPNDKVLPALRLSYHRLSSQLKQCFSYLAIVPKDFEMSKKDIIYLWMAQGFLQRKGGEMMEELGEKWLDELVSRSFLQKSGYQLDDQPTFLMHDLIHDLAQHCCGKFLVRMEGDNSCEVSEKTRHLSYYENARAIDSSRIVKAICETHGLRTFLIKPFWNSYQTPESLQNQISQLKCLRVLWLIDFRNIGRLPDLLDKLKQLRYLNLDGTRVEILPESVCTLYNLQILSLYGCKILVELPRNMRNLIDLYCLDIRETPRLLEMPQGMGDLKELRTLHKFSVGKQNCANIDDLGKLRLLQRELSIINLQNVTEISADILKNKENLEDLKLKWNGETEDSKSQRAVLERLQPCTIIKKLSICGYGGTKLPDWVGKSYYKNIVSLKLKRCLYLSSLPSLGQLSCLEFLLIKKFHAVVEVGVEFCKVPFSSLKTLKIEDMKLWEDWVICEEKDSVNCKSFPKLESLKISNCPKLKSISTCEPTHKIFKCRYLKVRDCPNLKTSNLLAVSSFQNLEIEIKGRQVCLRQMPSEMYRLYVSNSWIGPERCNPIIEGNEEMQILFNALEFEEIEIEKNKLLQCIPLDKLPKLRHLFVRVCYDLERLSASEDPLHLPLLASLEISYCSSLMCVSEGGITAPNLTRLILKECSNLKSLPIPEGITAQNHFQSLEHLEILGCDKLIDGLFQWGLQKLNALSHLSLERRYKGDDLDYFPVNTLLPCSLTSLEIRGDNLMEGRLNWGLERLHALSNLCLSWYSGDDLDSFPEQTLLPPTLRLLEIREFLNLKLINYEGLHHLTSLAELEIVKCPNLRRLPELGLPSSLSVLKILGCPLLEQRCKRDEGEDWPKISHISTIRISRRNI